MPEVLASWHRSLVEVLEQSWYFQYVADDVAPDGLEQDLASALGEGMRVNLFRRKFIQPASSGKFSLLKPLAR